MTYIGWLILDDGTRQHVLDTEVTYDGTVISDETIVFTNNNSYQYGGTMYQTITFIVKRYTNLSNSIYYIKYPSNVNRSLDIYKFEFESNVYFYINNTWLIPSEEIEVTSIDVPINTRTGDITSFDNIEKFKSSNNVATTQYGTFPCNITYYSRGTPCVFIDKDNYKHLDCFDDPQYIVIDGVICEKNDTENNAMFTYKGADYYITASKSHFTYCYTEDANRNRTGNGYIVNLSGPQLNAAEILMFYGTPIFKIGWYIAQNTLKWTDGETFVDVETPTRIITQGSIAINGVSYDVFVTRSPPNGSPPKEEPVSVETGDGGSFQTQFNARKTSFIDCNYNIHNNVIITATDITVNGETCDISGNRFTFNDVEYRIQYDTIAGQENPIKIDVVYTGDKVVFLHHCTF